MGASYLTSAFHDFFFFLSALSFLGESNDASAVIGEVRKGGGGKTRGNYKGSLRVPGVRFKDGLLKQHCDRRRRVGQGRAGERVRGLFWRREGVGGGWLGGTAQRVGNIYTGM